MSITTETTQAHSYVTGLRTLAALLEEHPELADAFNYQFSISGIHAMNRERGPETLARFARAALHAGGTVDKDIDETWHNLILTFAGIKVKVLAYREEVCERVQVGTETVTRTERDPAAVEAALAAIPEVETTEEVPVFEWQCGSILAGTEAS